MPMLSHDSWLKTFLLKALDYVYVWLAEVCSGTVWEVRRELGQVI